MGTRITTIHVPDNHFTGVPRLLEDLKILAQDTESADIIFVVGKDEVPIYAHRVILTARCQSFRVKRGEICKISGCSITPSALESPPLVRLPLYQAETFKQFITYIYTGMILLQEDNSIFEMIIIAQDFEVEELRKTCEEHVASTLSILNACTFLTTGTEIQARKSGNYMKQLVERCFSYIGDNAVECFKTNSFLNLSKDNLNTLISSDCIEANEEDVWRAVLNWAKYQAGVTQPTAHWTEEEKSRVCLHLAGVIGNVKLFLIDSKVFAEEVEPTGAVPMELSLERYRFAAVPDKFQERSDDKNLQPRKSSKFFSGSLILLNKHQNILNQWFGNTNQQWKLIYRASIHGYSAEAFHKHCDMTMPTYVIISGPKGHICGGFSDIPWNRSKPCSKGQYFENSEKAFLFTLANTEGIPPTKFDIKKKSCAICYHHDVGPVFGAGADLFIASDCNTNTDSYSNFPHSYEGENATNNILMGDYNFQVLDYEVFCPVTK